MSSVSLVLCSEGYFVSPNCMRELLRAVVTDKPIVALLESEEKHGGLTRDEIEAQLRSADEPCDKNGTNYDSKYAMWKLAGEVQSWGYAMPSAQQLIDALFADEQQLIEWNRLGFFQQVTMRLIAER